MSEEFAQRTTLGDRVAAFIVGFCVGGVIDFGLYAFGQVDSRTILIAVALGCGLLAAFAWNQFWKFVSTYFNDL